jgi:hypothetical protein
MKYLKKYALFESGDNLRGELDTEYIEDVIRPLRQDLGIECELKVGLYSISVSINKFKARIASSDEELARAGLQGKLHSGEECMVSFREETGRLFWIHTSGRKEFIGGQHISPIGFAWSDISGEMHHLISYMKGEGYRFGGNDNFGIRIVEILNQGVAIDSERRTDQASFLGIPPENTYRTFTIGDEAELEKLDPDMRIATVRIVFS